ncbi:hypothetical protein OS31_49100 [Dickeya oryzae]
MFCGHRYDGLSQKTSSQDYARQLSAKNKYPGMSGDVVGFQTAG